MIPDNLTKKQLRRKSTDELLRIIEDCPYSSRDKAIGNNRTIQHVFEILHNERKVIEVDCEIAYCFENHNN